MWRIIKKPCETGRNHTQLEDWQDRKKMGAKQQLLKTNGTLSIKEPHGNHKECKPKPSDHPRGNPVRMLLYTA